MEMEKTTEMVLAQELFEQGLNKSAIPPSRAGWGVTARRAGWGVTVRPRDAPALAARHGAAGSEELFGRAFWKSFLEELFGRAS